MTVRGKITTKGLEKYIEAVAEMGKDIDPVVDQALEAGAGVLLDGMKERVPKDTHNLENHLVVGQIRKSFDFHYIYVGLLFPDAETARYGTVQEYGSSKMAAQPYFRPTMDEDASKARTAMRHVLKAAGLKE